MSFWVKGLPLLVFALFIDALQAALAWSAFALGAGLQALTPAGGAVGGAAAGGALCWSEASGVVSGVVEAAKCAAGGGIVGSLASLFGVPLGVALGFALEICISLTFGFGLIVLLYMSGLYSNTRMASAGFVEIIPALNSLPAWTLMVVLCLLKKYTEEKAAGPAGAAKMVGVATQLAAGGPLNVVNGINTLNQQVTEARERAPMPRLQEVATSLKNPGINKDVRPYVEKVA